MAKYEKGKDEARLKALAKKEEEKQKEMMNQLFKVAVVAPVLAPGVDPKSVLCPYWKAGQCTRGDKCKYSHNEAAGQKSAKLDVYQDRRDGEPKQETNEDWDEEKLRTVVQEKGKGQKIQSQIICKFFIEAVRDKKYGWFWECPNGNDTCHYRHALPPGFVIEKKKKTLDDDKEEGPPLEEILEGERQKLGGVGTPVTLEKFNEWKSLREKRRADAAKLKDEARAKEAAAGRAVNLTGRELLQFKPELFENQDPEEDMNGGFDLTKLRKQLLEEEDAEAAASVASYQEKTKDFDLDVDESLFLNDNNEVDAVPPPDEDDDEGNKEGEGKTE